MTEQRELTAEEQKQFDRWLLRMQPLDVKKAATADRRRQRREEVKKFQAYLASLDPEQIDREKKEVEEDATKEI